MKTQNDRVKYIELLRKSTPNFGNLNKKGKEKKFTTERELSALFIFLRLKRKRRFNNPEKALEEHTESVAEHVYMMQVLARYFLPQINRRLKKEGKKGIPFPSVASCILAHDPSEGLLGDVPVVYKTKEDGEDESSAIDTIKKNYLPEAGGMNKRILEEFRKYENAKKSLSPEYAVLVKALDMLEAYLYIADEESKEKLKNMTLMSRRNYVIGKEGIIYMFKEVGEFWDELMNMLEPKEV